MTQGTTAAPHSHPERREVVLSLNEVLNGGADLGEDAVDDVHHAVGRDLVPVDDARAVHSDDLGEFGESRCGVRPRAGPPLRICAGAVGPKAGCAF